MAPSAAEQRPSKEAQVTIASSAEGVRLALENLKERPNNDPVRKVDPDTGTLTLLSSVSELKQAVPGMSPDLLRIWSSMPIFNIRLFVEKRHFDEGGVSRAYGGQEFPLGEPLMKAIFWWRKRVKRQNSGFAIFEGGFDMSGPIYLTPPPRLCMDAATGEVDGDCTDEIERKKQLHFKRLQMDERWEGKGISMAVRQKIEGAELRIAEKKLRGQEYMLRGGWVDKGSGLDILRANEIQKKFQAPQEKKPLSIAAGTILSAR